MRLLAALTVLLSSSVIAVAQPADEAVSQELLLKMSARIYVASGAEWVNDMMFGMVLRMERKRAMLPGGSGMIPKGTPMPPLTDGQQAKLDAGRDALRKKESAVWSAAYVRKLTPAQIQALYAFYESELGTQYVAARKASHDHATAKDAPADDRPDKATDAVALDRLMTAEGRRRNKDRFAAYYRKTFTDAQILKLIAFVEGADYQALRSASMRLRRELGPALGKLRKPFVLEIARPIYKAAAAKAAPKKEDGSGTKDDGSGSK